VYDESHIRISCTGCAMIASAHCISTKRVESRKICDTERDEMEF